MTINSEKFSPKLVFIAVGLLVFGLVLVWFAYSQQDDTNDSGQEQVEQTAQDNQDTQTTDAEKLYVLNEENLAVFKYPEDLVAAPSELPEGFVSYLNGLLERNRVEAETGADCVAGYYVSKFSSEIVRGGQELTVSSDVVPEDDCTGGGFAVWTAGDNGVWGELYGGQDRPNCSVLEENEIPPEFEENCLGENGEGPFFNPLAPRGYEEINL